MEVTSDERSTQLLVQSLLDRHRNGFVMAIGDDGLAVELPSAIEGVGPRVAPGRSMLDIVERAHRLRVIEAWEQVRTAGGSQTLVRLTGGDDDTVVHFLDARSLHGVYLAFLNPTGGGDLPRAPTAFERAATTPPRVAVVRKDQVAVFVAVDRATVGMLGWTAEDLVQSRSLDLVHPDDHNLAIESWLDLLERPETQERVRLRYRTRDRGYRWLELTNHNRLHDLDHGDVLTEMIDVTEEVAAVDALRASEQLLRRLADTVPVGLVQVDRDGRVAYANDCLAELVRRPLAVRIEDQLAGARGEDRVALLGAVDAVLTDGEDRDVDARFTSDAPHTDVVHATVAIRALTDDAGATTGAIICVSDVTEAAKTHDDLAQRALRDPLTGGHNRPGLLAELDDLLADGERRTAVLFVDLDGFKAVNDEHGHQAGDEVLRVTARQLRRAMRSTDIVGRLGGDEFVVLCPDVRATEAADLASRAGRFLGSPLVIDGVVIPVEASIGLAHATGGSSVRSPADLIAAADAAMYRAKHDRRDGGPGHPVTVDLDA